MTLPRTIHRREARKRAKARPKSSGRTFITLDWIARSHIDRLRAQFGITRLINREYLK